MSDPNDLNQNEKEDLEPTQEEPELGIDNNSHKPEETITGKRKQDIDTSGLDNASAILKAITSLQQIAEVNKKNEARKLREMTYNAATLDESKKKKFVKYLLTARAIYDTKPEIIKGIFEDNEINSAKDGLTLTTMAMAWLEVYGLEDSVTLEKMKKRIHSMIYAATHYYGASIYGTPITKFRYLYYITTDPDDAEKQAKGHQATSDVFNRVAENREAFRQQLLKDLEEKKKEEEEKLKPKPVIEVTETGEQQVQEQEQKTKEGEDSEKE